MTPKTTNPFSVALQAAFGAGLGVALIWILFTIVLPAAGLVVLALKLFT